MRNSGYFIEILGYPFECFDAFNYAALLIVDTEEEFSEGEILKLNDDLVNKGLSLIVFADWYNITVMKKAKLFDENTGQWWVPETGGSNIPALNDLLRFYNISFGDGIYDGVHSLNEHTILFASGTSIVKFPKGKNSFLIYRDLDDQGEDFLKDKQIKAYRIPILGLHQVNTNDNSGRVVVYGDSNC